ncbi:MAG: carboxypeptidase-like regulatory domain-containing protein [Salinivirgaceae bacterium]|nr:carboxypeptidase-like regulatory domain-containing protein [Salinivirgaceae bacterium]
MKKVFIILGIALVSQLGIAANINEKSTDKAEATNTYIIVRGNLSESMGDNHPLAFANVFVEGTDEITSTDIDGNFELKVQSQALELKFTFMGYESYTKNIKAQPGETVELKVELKPKSSSIN